MSEVLEIEDVRRLHLEPGDVLVLRLAERAEVDMEAALATIREMLPDQPVMVLVGSAEEIDLMVVPSR